MTASRYHFDKATADAAVEYFPRFIRHVKGEWYRKPFHLSPFQAHDIGQIFGWKRRDGTRRYRRARIWEPRKQGKTLKAAGLGHLLTIGDGEPGAEVYSHATDENQARICWQMGASMTAMSPALFDLYEVTKQGMLCPALMSAWLPLSGEPKGKHGYNSHANIGDEVHEWTSDRLHKFLMDSMSTRRQPLDITISTAGLRDTYAWELYQESVKIRDDESYDEETYVSIYAADEKDDWTSPDVWAKAMPNLGISVKRDFIEDLCRQAQKSTRLENDFRRYYLNQWVSQAVRWLSMDDWRKCTAEPNNPILWKELPDRLKGKRCFGGLDLASTKDLCAFVLVFPVQDGVDTLTVLPFFWTPVATVEPRTRRDRLAYERWCSREVGAITATPGNVTDYGFIRECILRACADYQVQQINIDRYNATHLTVELQADGVPCEFMIQGFLSLSPPSKELERLVMSRQLEHGNHPVLEWNADNVEVVSDAAGNIKPVKDKENSPRKIDGISATVNALALAMSSPIARQSVYETRGLMEIDI